jgi:hypothetical protein
MKKLILLTIAIFAMYFAFSQSKTWVNGYRKSNGTYVEGHYRSSANSTNHDNWSTKGNINPNTSSKGYRAPDYSRQATNYGAGKTIQIGPKGGQYYRNSSGNKVYVPKKPTTTYPTTTDIRSK